MWNIIIYCFAAVGFLLIAALLLTLLEDFIEDILRQYNNKIYDKAKQESENILKIKLENAAYWFSEDKPTMDLLLGLSNGISTDTLREKWREAKKQKVED